MGRAAALWPLLFLTFIFFVVIITIKNVSTGVFIVFGCILGLFMWYWIEFLRLDDDRENFHNERQRTQTGDIESNDRQEATRTRIMIARVRAQREPLHDMQLFSFASRAHIARLSMRALPPVTCFLGDGDGDGDETTESQRNCPICMEDFKKGELLQPFGVCVHKFHSSCVNSWLLGGKITCPVCRKELSITVN